MHRQVHALPSTNTTHASMQTESSNGMQDGHDIDLGPAGGVRFMVTALKTRLGDRLYVQQKQHELSVHVLSRVSVTHERFSCLQKFPKAFGQSSINGRLPLALHIIYTQPPKGTVSTSGFSSVHMNEYLHI